VCIATLQSAPACVDTHISTCCSTGIGYETVKHLARRGAKVYLGARNESRATGALAKLEHEGLGPGNGKVIWLKTDFGDIRSAKAAAEEFLKREGRLDILGEWLNIICNLNLVLNAHFQSIMPRS
jgi:NAD(P)-dependent dehydrogenase (short-subunit alcohol dehydrogenase family)